MDPDDEDAVPDLDDVVVVELTDELDLHTFHPRDVAQLVADYCDECAARGWRHVRIIHGKGIGNLRRTVHAALRRHPLVSAFRLGDQVSGSWGATLVTLALDATSDDDGGGDDRR